MIFQGIYQQIPPFPQRNADLADASQIFPRFPGVVVYVVVIAPPSG